MHSLLFDSWKLCVSLSAYTCPIPQYSVLCLVLQNISQVFRFFPFCLGYWMFASSFFLYNFAFSNGFFYPKCVTSDSYGSENYFYPKFITSDSYGCENLVLVSIYNQLKFQFIFSWFLDFWVPQFLFYVSLYYRAYLFFSSCSKYTRIQNGD